MTDITERLKEAHALYDKVGVNFVPAAGLMVDALAKIEELEAKADHAWSKVAESDTASIAQVAESISNLSRIAELEAARDFGIIEGDAVAHLKVVALQTRVEELTAALDALRGRYRLYSGWPEMSWAGDTDVALLKMADQALGDTT
jgi:hypothetical protein